MGSQSALISLEGILLVCYKKGDLERYITEEKEVDNSVKTTWILSAISTVYHLHHVSRVLVYGIALRNFLLTDDLSTLKMIDFGQASIFPPNTDITTASNDGTTTQVDIFHLGCVIYSISWQSYHNDLAHHDWVPPPVEDLPKLDGLGPWGEIIKKCWCCQYRSSKELHDETLALFHHRHRIACSQEVDKAGFIINLLSQRWFDVTFSL